MPNTADRPPATVATRDIAAAAVRLLTDDSWIGQETVPVIGPDFLSRDAMAQVLTEILERPVSASNGSTTRHTRRRWSSTG
ncbi:hypothetical protein [Streptomyces sp. NPDC005046]